MTITDRELNHTYNIYELEGEALTKALRGSYKAFYDSQEQYYKNREKLWPNTFEKLDEDDIEELMYLDCEAGYEYTRNGEIV